MVEFDVLVAQNVRVWSPSLLVLLQQIAANTRGPLLVTTQYYSFTSTRNQSGVFLPENMMPVFFHIGHLVEGDVQDLTHPVCVLTVPCAADPTLIQGVPVLHENSRHVVTFRRNTPGLPLKQANLRTNVLKLIKNATMYF